MVTVEEHPGKCDTLAYIDLIRYEPEARLKEYTRGVVE
jgi:hypothetical protein